MHIEKFTSPFLNLTHFRVIQGEAWCLIGSNRSGVDQFLQLLSHDLHDYSAKRLSLPQSLALLSFSLQQEIFEQEVINDETDFLGRIDPGTPARHFLKGREDITALVESFNMKAVLDTGYRQLSTGESRKLLILHALAQGKDFLVIQNPYDGLDQSSCREFNMAMENLQHHSVSLIITVNNQSDIPSWCTHIAHFHEETICRQGTRESVLPHIDLLLDREKSPLEIVVETFPEKKEKRLELVSLKDGFATYDNTLIFEHLDLTIMEGQHTLISGPNGCGKSTLLQMITGDNSNCYSNSLRIFGNLRGSGESIWDLKKQMGIVSSDLHRNYYTPGKALHVVLSGLFDSIGIYQKHKKHQGEKALWWLTLMGIEQKANLPFKQLTYAEQRLVLIARALVKMPRLLVLDEPTQGLDEWNRNSLLAFLEKISDKKLSTIIYASHRKDEFLSFFQQHLHLEHSSPSVTYLPH